MAQIDLSLPGLYERAFGYKSHAFEPEFKPVSGYTPPGRKVSGLMGAPYYGTAAEGIEYYMPVTLSYINPSGSKQSYALPHPVISIYSQKRVVETLMPGQPGSVKEVIARGGYTIAIKGIITATENELPEEHLSRLMQLYEQAEAVSITSALTDIALLSPRNGSSDQALITSLSLPPVTGVKNVRAYELVLLSDVPFTLYDA